MLLLTLLSLSIQLAIEIVKQELCHLGYLFRNNKDRAEDPFDPFLTRLQCERQESENDSTNVQDEFICGFSSLNKDKSCGGGGGFVAMTKQRMKMPA